MFDQYIADEWSEVKLLAIGAAAGRLIVGNRNVSTLEGMQGAKMVPFASMATPVVQGMGMVPVQLEVAEHYTALSTGTIDAAVSPINNLLPPWNLDEVANYAIINTPASSLPLFVAMNRQTYEGLSPEHRQVIDEIAGLPLSIRADPVLRRLRRLRARVDRRADQGRRTEDRMDRHLGRGARQDGSCSGRRDGRGLRRLRRARDR